MAADMLGPVVVLADRQVSARYFPQLEAALGWFHRVALAEQEPAVIFKLPVELAVPPLHLVALAVVQQAHNLAMAAMAGPLAQRLPAVVVLEVATVGLAVVVRHSHQQPQQFQAQIAQVRMQQQQVQ